MTLFIPPDGRITSQNILSGPLNGGEVQEIVSPGNEAQGVTYQVTTDTLAAFYAAFPALNTTFITSGATLASPYHVLTTDTRILFDKTLASASYTVCPASATMLYHQQVLFKDAKGDADTNPITITFSNGELCDGQSQIQITTPYGWFHLTPLPVGNGWYMS